MKISIFAEHHTKRRIVTVIGFKEQTRMVMIKLNEIFGGSWVYIQDLKPDEAIPFEASKNYHGFDNNVENDYCGNILKLEL